MIQPLSTQAVWKPSVMRPIAFAAALLLIAAPAPGAGWYNLPTSLQQCMGLGFGPGHHAPMLLGPVMKVPTSAQRIQRLPSAPQSAGAHGCFGAPGLIEPSGMGAYPAVWSHPNTQVSPY